MRFRPDGAPNGFARRVPETYVRDAATQGARSGRRPRACARSGRRRLEGRLRALQHARAVAADAAGGARRPHVRLSSAPRSSARRASGCALTVAGDELTEVAPYVHVPESFERRFQELRSANDTIAGIASLSAGLLYGLGGCILGVLWLARAALARGPARAGGRIRRGRPDGGDGAGGGAGRLVRVRHRASGDDLLGASGRRALAALHRRRRWRTRSCSWRRRASRAARFRTSRSSGASGRARRARRAPCSGAPLGGYLFVPLELALVAAFYYATNRWLGWWQPSEVLTDPNILSSALPALMPIAVSLQAGFMEECVFRAVPLALGALHRRAFRPARARHRRRVRAAGGDLRRRARQLPRLSAVFASGRARRAVDALGARSSCASGCCRRSCCTRCSTSRCSRFRCSWSTRRAHGCSAPRWSPRRWCRSPWCSGAGGRAGAWGELPAVVRGTARGPAAATARNGRARGTGGRRRARAADVSFSAWLPGLASRAWSRGSRSRRCGADVPSCRSIGGRAEAAADAALKARGVTLGPEWRRFSTVRGGERGAVRGPQHKFVWREAGPEVYRALVGTTLAPPLWDVRYATFEGDVAAAPRSGAITIEPAMARCGRSGTSARSARPGAHLERDAALGLAAAASARTVRRGSGRAARSRAAEQRNAPARTRLVVRVRGPARRRRQGRRSAHRGGTRRRRGRCPPAVPSTCRSRGCAPRREREGRLQVVKIAAGLPQHLPDSRRLSSR